MLRYSEAHAAFKRANKTELKRWRGNPTMEAVESNAFAIAELELHPVEQSDPTPD